MQKIVLASKNSGKLKEFQAILDRKKYVLILQDDNVLSPEETGLTFIENAFIKARAVCRATGLPAIADDSGLIVPALNGAPGIYSARYAGIHANDQDNREKLIQAIQSIPPQKRHAYFQCAIVLLKSENDPVPLIAQASWHGMMTDMPKGTHGFGYDALFYLPSLNCTAAELLPEEKNRISHRAQALKELNKM